MCYNTHVPHDLFYSKHQNYLLSLQTGPFLSSLDLLSVADLSNSVNGSKWYSDISIAFEAFYVPPWYLLT